MGRIMLKHIMMSAASVVSFRSRVQPIAIPHHLATAGLAVSIDVPLAPFASGGEFAKWGDFLAPGAALLHLAPGRVTQIFIGSVVPVTERAVWGFSGIDSTLTG